MKAFDIKFPANLNLDRLPFFIQLEKELTDPELLNSLEDDLKYGVLDFEKTRFITPFAACFLGRIYHILSLRLQTQTVDEVIDIRKTGVFKNSKSFIRKRLPENESAQIQFYKLGLVGMPIKEIEEKMYGKPYFPVTSIKSAGMNVVNNLLNLLVQQIPSMPSGVRDAVHFGISELLTNVKEHSQSPEGNFISGNIVSSKQLIRICVLDSGIGIRASLSSNPRYATIGSDIEAIELSMKYGVTRYADQSRGIFLENLTRLVESNGGKLDIISGDGRVTVSPEKKFSKRLACYYQGTIVNLELKSRKSFSPKFADWEEGVDSWIMP